MSQDEDNATASGRGASESMPPGYFMIAGQSDGGGVTLLGLWRILWSQRLLIVGIGALFAIGAVVVSLLLTEIYRADSVLAPVTAEEVPDVAGRLGGLASLAGIRVGTSSDASNAVAILRSREFAAKFIEEQELMPLLYDELWDSEAGDWAVATPDEIPRTFDAVKLFHENVFSVKEDPLSGLVTIAIEWKQPQQAAAWVNALVERINRETRARALTEAQTNLSYLQGQLESAKVVELRYAISRIIESELKKIMIANAREQYAFRIIDPAMVPTRKIRPRRALIVIITTFLGGVLALVVALVRHTVRQQRAQSASIDRATSVASGP